MNTSKPGKNIISNENYDEDMGYLVERYENDSIYTTIWFFTNNGEEINHCVIYMTNQKYMLILV